MADASTQSGFTQACSWLAGRHPSARAARMPASVYASRGALRALRERNAASQGEPLD